MIEILQDSAKHQFSHAPAPHQVEQREDEVNNHITVDTDAAFSSFLRGISKIRMAQMGENVLPHLSTLEEKRRVLRSTMALDYLQARNVHKKVGQVVTGDGVQQHHEESRQQQMADVIMN